MSTPAQPVARGFAMVRPGAAAPQAEPEDRTDAPAPLPPDAKVDLASQEQALLDRRTAGPAGK